MTVKHKNLKDIPTLVITNSPSQLEKYIDNIISSYSIPSYSIYSVTKEEGKKGLTVEQVRLVTGKFQTTDKEITKLILFYEMQTASASVQNALLKFLEEPPANTIILLISNRKDLMLPTILSRVQCLELPLDTQTVKAENILDLSFSDRLVLAENLAKNPQQSIYYLRSFLNIVLQEKIKKHYINNDAAKEYAKILSITDRTIRLLENTNVNPRLLLENYMLELPKN
jgi:DNA polymerase-3 subunit delta'